MLTLPATKDFAVLSAEELEQVSGGNWVWIAEGGGSTIPSVGTWDIKKWFQTGSQL